jgi:hypothetical protein
MDVSYASTFNYTPPFPDTLQARRLRLYDSKTVEKYLDKYEQLITDKGLIKRQIKLRQSVHQGIPLTPAQRLEADAIDALKTQAMKKAEHQCRKLRMGGVRFSEATEGPRRRIIFWEMAIRRRKGKRVSSRLWRRKKAKAGIVERTKDLTIYDMWSRLRQARLEYREAKKNHEAERQSFLTKLRPKDRDRLEKAEQQRALGRLAKSISGKQGGGNVTKVIHNDIECTSRKEVEDILLRVNEAKIRACEDTPFMCEPLVSDFGYRNNTPASQAVLEGTYVCPPGTDRFAALLIDKLKRPPLSPTATPFVPRKHITLEDNTRAWNKAKERTAAGLSGLHFGMYKAHAKRPRLSAFDASMRSVAYMTGFSYNRWKRGVDVQLLKKKKDFRAEKLRTILLLEADLNMNNKALGRDTMKLGERHNLLTKDNYGGRKGHRAVEVALNTQLTYDSIRGRRGRAIVMSNDAKGCYD